MTHVSRYHEERGNTWVERYLKGTARPPFLPGTKQAVVARDTPPGMTHPSCYFCKATVFDDELALHHGEAWQRLRRQLLKDHEFMTAEPEMQEVVGNQVYSDVNNLFAAHKACNSADGYKARDEEAWERVEQRRRENPKEWML